MPKVNTRTTATGTVRYFVRFRADGAQRSEVFDTRTEAEQFARDVDQRGGQWALDNLIAEQEAADEMTLDQWAVRYLDNLTVSPGALDNYRRDWRLRWQPHLGHLRLSRITREDIVQAVKKQTGAPKTIENAWGTLATMLKVAVLDGHIDRSPAIGVKLPKHEGYEKTEHRYMTAVELQQVIADTAERYKPLMWMLVGTGMRWSEATALTVADVDVAAKTVRVTKAWKRDREKGAWYVGPPKTAKSKRTITLPNEVVDAVKPLLEGRKRTDLLFTNRRGDWIRHQTFYREHWVVNVTAKKERRGCTANIADPRPRIHDIRHSHVALLIAAGVSLPVIQARLGHEKITTTIDTYGHLMPDLQIAAADAASRVLALPPSVDLIETAP